MTELQLILEQSAAEGWTQSEITTMDDCSMMWWWRYGLGLRRKGNFSWASIYGSAFHSTMEEMYATAGKRWQPAPLKIPEGINLTGSQLADKEYWESVLKVQTERYAQYYADDFRKFEIIKSEMDVDIEKEWLGVKLRLRGKIDLTFTIKDDGDRLWILDHKTTSRLDFKTVAGWDFRFQFMFYLWLGLNTLIEQNIGKKFAGYYINAIKKPTIRQKQNESRAEFFARLNMNMAAEPENYYYRDRLLLTANSISHFENFVLKPKLNRIRLLTNPETPDIVKETLALNPNTNRCQLYGVCEFLPLCEHGLQLEGFQYEKRAAKHEELLEEATE